MQVKFRIPEILLGALLAVAVFAMGVTFQSSSYQPTNEGAATNSNHSSGVIAPKESENKLTDWLLVLFNGLLFGSTVLLWIANNRSAKIAERALIDLERPFVLPIELEVPIRKIGASIVFEYKMRWENSGRTPAIEVQMSFNFISTDGGLPPGFTYPDFGEPGAFGYVAPGGKHWSAPIAFSPAQIREVMKGQVQLYFYGWVKYRDIFGGTESHVTKFCWKSEPVGDDPEGVGGEIEFRGGPFGPHNWIDKPHSQQ